MPVVFRSPCWPLGGGGAGSSSGQASFGGGKGANGCVIVEEYA